MHTLQSIKHTKGCLEFSQSFISALETLHQDGRILGGMTTDLAETFLRHPEIPLRLIAPPLLDTIPPERQEGFGDYRSDFFSLGKFVLSMFPELPASLKLIFQKCAHPDSNERYQSYFGLSSDLSRCQSDLAKSQDIHPFLPGAQDYPLIPSFSTYLFGRDGYRQQFTETLSAVELGGFFMSHFLGTGGVGKTALIQTLLRPLVPENFCFIHLKFSQASEQNTGFFQSFLKQFHHLLITQALDSHAIELQLTSKDLLTDLTTLYPPLSELFKHNTPPTTQNDEMSQNRHIHLLHEFLVIFEALDTPLIIHIDDLQWADKLSLCLIQSMTQHQHRSLWIIATERTQKSESILPKLSTFCGYKSLTLSGLCEADVIEQISHCLNCSSEDATELTQLIYPKTLGNPLYTAQLLRRLFEEELIFRDTQRHHWVWDKAGITALPYTSRVGDLMCKRLHDLNTDTLSVLEAAALLGYEFSFSDLCQCLDRDALSLEMHLRLCELKGFISPLPRLKNGHPEPYSAHYFTFLHDYIHDAILSLNPDLDSRRLDLGLQFYTASLTDAPPHFAKLALIQFARCEDITSLEDFFDTLLQLSTEIALEEKHQAHYAFMDALLQSAQRFITDTTQPEDVFRHYHLSITAAYLNKDFERTETLYAILQGYPLTPDQYLALSSLQVEHYASRGQLQTSITIGLSALKTAGFSVPKQPKKAHILWHFLKTQWMFKRKEGSTTLRTIDTTSTRHQASIQILAHLAAPTYVLKDKSLFAYLMILMTRLSLQQGNTGFSPFGYLTYGVFICSLFKRYKQAYHLSNVAISLIEDFNLTDLKSRLYMTKSMFIDPWSRPIRNCIPLLQKGYEEGKKTGDFWYAVYSQLYLARASWQDALPHRITLLEELMPFVHSLKNQNMVNTCQISLSYFQALHDDFSKNASLNGPHFEESTYLKENLENEYGSGLFIYYFYKGCLAYYRNDYTGADVSFTNAEPYMEAVLSLFCFESEFYFFQATTLGLLSHLNQAPKHAKKAISRGTKKFKKWAQSCPENFLGSYLFLQGIQTLEQKKYASAITFFHQALLHFQQQRFLEKIAITQEALLVCKRQTNSPDVDSQMRYAQESYQVWGSQKQI